MSEIESIEAKLPIGMWRVLSQLERDRLLAGARRERNAHMRASFWALLVGLKSLVVEARKIAVRCTAARLHHQG